MTKDVFELGENEELNALKKKVGDLEAQLAGLNPRNLAGLNAKELRAAVRANIFGDGTDGEYTLNASQAAVSGLFGLSGTTFTLLRDGFFTNLTVASGFTLKPGGFRIFCTKDFINNGDVVANGNNGTAGTAGVDDGTVGSAGGAGGTAINTSGSLPPGIAGSTGGQGGDDSADNGSTGVVGTDCVKSLGTAGAGGGGGGAGGGTGGSGGNGGNGGSQLGTVFNTPRSPSSVYTLLDRPSFVAHESKDAGDTHIAEGDGMFYGFCVLAASGSATVAVDGTTVQSMAAGTQQLKKSFSVPVRLGQTYLLTVSAESTATAFFMITNAYALTNSAGAGGGGGGGGPEDDVAGTGGGGGGGGGTGGFIVIFPNRIINNGNIQVHGGAGGNGGKGGDGSGNNRGGGGGGGGAGGAGGVVITVFGTKSGSGTITSTAGAAGSGGAKGVSGGGFDGNAGSAGTAGNDGTVIEIQVDNV